MHEWCVFCAIFTQNIEFLSFHMDSQNATLVRVQTIQDGHCATHRFLFSSQTETNYAEQSWSIHTTLGLQTGKNLVFISQRQESCLYGVDREIHHQGRPVVAVDIDHDQWSLV